MKEKRSVLTAFNLILGIVGFVFLVSFSVTFTLNFRPLYYWDMERYAIPENSGYSAQIVRDTYDTLITYNNIYYRGELDFKDMPMSEPARIHFEEVKAVFGLFEIAMIIFGLLYAVGVIRQWLRRDYGWLKTTGISSLAIPGILAVFIASDWEAVFIGFHKLVFRNDYWLFDPYIDPVITILPDEFFMHCALMIILMIVLLSVFCLILHRFLMRRSNPAE